VLCKCPFAVVLSDGVIESKKKVPHEMINRQLVFEWKVSHWGC
jgi:UTP-glucose-1-phosphate uridylyltransferase